MGSLEHGGDARSRIRRFIRETFLYMRPDFALADDDRLMAKGVLDSMGAVELIQFLEQEFSVKIRDEEITEVNLGSIAAIAAFVESRRRLRESA